MANWIPASKGVRYREHATRKHGKRFDRYWCIQYKLHGKTINEALGWWSEGASQSQAEALLAELRVNHKSGKGLQTLKEMREAKQFEREAELAAKKVSANETKTLSQIWEKVYLPSAKLHKSNSSIKTETFLFDKWLAHLQDMPLSEIKPSDIERLVIAPMREADKSPRTIQYAIATISVIWNTAKDHNIVAGDSPTKRVKKPKQDNQRDRFLSKDEAALLLESLKRRSMDTHDLALLSLLSGMRAGECHALTWADIDFENAIIFVKDTKNTFNRHAHITAQIMEMLQRRYDDQPKSDVVFPCNTGETSKWSVSDSFAKTVQELGFNDGIADRRQKVVFHTLRHTFASWLVQMGTPLYTVSKLMGHKDIKMTMRYAHLAPDMHKAAVAQLEGVLS